VVATRRGPSPHTDAGAGVRRILHELRSRAIEHLNEQFKGIFDAHGQVPTTGLLNTRRVALGAVFVYQLTLWYRHEHGLDLRAGLKPFLKAASSFMTRSQLDHEVIWPYSGTSDDPRVQFLVQSEAGFVRPVMNATSSKMESSE
jgi:hypothetical protein